MLMAKEKCKECCYYDRRSGLCGFCMMKILREMNMMKEGKDDDRQDEAESAE